MTKHLKMAIALMIIAIGFTQQGFAQQVKPKMAYDQRIELAKMLHEPIRSEAIADPKSDARNQVTPYWVRIDPVWTAQFILDNPLPKNDPYFDNKAIYFLMAHPNLISDDVLLGILDQHKHTMLSFHYASTLIRKLPNDRRDLQNRVISTVLGSDDYPLQSPTTFSQIIWMAGKSDDPQTLERVMERIETFYTSGQAKTLFDKSTTTRTTYFASSPKFFTHQFAKYAPDKMKSDFHWDGDPSISENSILLSEVGQILTMGSISDDEKVARLNTIEKFDFGTVPIMEMTAAIQLGAVAVYDSSLALQWAARAPSPEAKAWALLTIATSVAKQDQAKANVLVKRSYSLFLQQMTTTRNLSDLRTHQYASFTPCELASSGLRLVAQVNPELLDDCIDKTIIAMKSLDSRFGNINEQRWHAIARIARYDQAKAEKLYDQFSDDVPVRDCVGFFRALTALHPDQFWDEYQSMPDADANGTDWRIYVRTRLVPALTEQDDTKFWDALVPAGSLDSGTFYQPSPY